MSFILNSRSQTVHRAGTQDKRCRLQQANPENIMGFPSLEEALEYFSGAKKSRLCPYCFPGDAKEPDVDD